MTITPGSTPNDVAVAMDGKSGAFVVTWDAVTQQTNGAITDMDVMARQYNAAGTAAAPAFALAAPVDATTGTGAAGGTPTERTARNPQVVMNDDGSFVIAWESYIPTAGTGTYNIFYQGFTAAGVAQFNGHANDQVDFPGNEVNALIAADGNDNFVIAWDGNGGQVVNGGSPTDLDNAGVFYRQFNAQGQATSGEMRANVTTAGVQQFPSVGMSRDGGLVVAWQGRGTVDRQGIYYRRFPAQYDTVGPAVAEVDTPTDQVIPEKGMVNQSVGYLVVTYDVDVNHQTASQSGYANTHSTRPITS